MPLPDAYVTIEITPEEQKSLIGTLAKAMGESPHWPFNDELQAVLDKIHAAKLEHFAGADDVR
jgi:hypothetical protein